MNFKAIRNQTELVFTTALPTDLLSYKVFPIIFSTTGSWGSLIFQVKITDEFALWYCSYIINEESSFIIQSPIEIICLHVAYKNRFDLDTKGLGNIKLNEAQFNLTHQPEIDTIAHFTPGIYQSFHISYNKGYLNRYVPYLPELRQFIANTENKIPCYLYPSHPYASYEMFGVIGNMLQYDYTNVLSRVFVECKALELLMHTVEKIRRGKNKDLIVNREDTDKFENIRTWLLANIDYSGSLAELSGQFHINEYKLKKGFKELYGATVFEMLLKLRMERAKQMLLETDLSVTEIGYRAGYSSGSHFSDAFRKHFGYPPTFLRKK